MAGGEGAGRQALVRQGEKGPSGKTQSCRPAGRQEQAFACACKGPQELGKRRPGGDVGRQAGRQAQVVRADRQVGPNIAGRQTIKVQAGRQAGRQAQIVQADRHKTAGRQACMQAGRPK